MFLWQFLLPLIIFAVAYWKILAVVRRQAKVAADRHQITNLPEEPVAGPSGKTAETAVDASTKTEDKSHVKAAAAAGQRKPGRVRSKVSKTLSKAQINVVQTMVYITVCFTLCWMPMYAILMLTKLSVRHLLRRSVKCLQ